MEAEGDCPNWVYWDEAGPVTDGQRHSNGELENNSRKPRDLTRNRHSDSLTKSQLTLFQGMMKKGAVILIADGDDDEVRTSASQNRVTATLCTEK